MVAWGDDDDVFTGVKKYRRWGEKMLAALGEGLIAWRYDETKIKPDTI